MKNEKTGSRKRKMLLFLPLLAIPFLTLLFWVMGGGSAGAAAEKTSSGLNLELPGAQLKENKAMNKLSFYEAADKDSNKRRDEIETGPHYPSFSVSDSLPSTGLSFDPYWKGYPDANEQKVYQKLSEINRQISTPSISGRSAKNQEPSVFSDRAPNKEDVDRLEGLMRNMNSEKENDPEMHGLNTMMEKILDIQHPERVKERLKEKSELNKSSVYAVTNLPFSPAISLLDTATNKRQPQSLQFFGADEEIDNETNAVEALVHQNQELVNGAVIKLRLLQDIYVDGSMITKGSLIYGVCSLNNERLKVEVSSIQSKGSVFPVQLSLYDMDGLEGIYIPGAITRDVAKESADQTLQSVELGTLDPSIKAKAVAAGITATKNLLSKKTKLIKVTVKAGYKVLLRDKSQNNS